MRSHLSTQQVQVQYGIITEHDRARGAVCRVRSFGPAGRCTGHERGVVRVEPATEQNTTTGQIRFHSTQTRYVSGAGNSNQVAKVRGE
jgi:hypothetical protein